MTRPSDWSSLGYDKDPTPGEPTTVTELAHHVRGIADGIRQSLQRFDQLNHAEDEFWKSEAAEGFKEIKGDLPGDMKMAETRYEKVAEALEGWVEALGGAQSRADDALRRANTARDDLAYANNGIGQMNEHKERAETEAREHNQNFPDDPPVEAEPWNGQDFHALKADAEERLRQAKEDAGGAKTDRDNAGNHAGRLIEDAYNDDLKNKPWWRKALLVLSDILSVVAAIVGILAIFCPILAPLALGLALVSLGLTAILVMTGDKTFADLALELLGLATFGIGRFATSAVRLARMAAPMSKMVSASRFITRGNAILSTGKGLPRMLGRVFNPASGKMMSGAALARNTVKQGVTGATADLKAATAAYNKIAYPAAATWRDSRGVVGVVNEWAGNINTLKGPGLAIMGSDLTGVAIGAEQARGAIVNMATGAPQYKW